MPLVYSVVSAVFASCVLACCSSRGVGNIAVATQETAAKSASTAPEGEVQVGSNGGSSEDAQPLFETTWLKLLSDDLNSCALVEATANTDEDIAVALNKDSIDGNGLDARVVGITKADGAVRWDLPFGGPGKQRVTDVAGGSDGSYYVTGVGTPPRILGGNPHHLGWVARIVGGRIVWSKTYPYGLWRVGSDENQGVVVQALEGKSSRVIAYTVDGNERWRSDLVQHSGDEFYIQDLVALSSEGLVALVNLEVKWLDGRPDGRLSSSFVMSVFDKTGSLESHEILATAAVFGSAFIRTEPTRGKFEMFITDSSGPSSRLVFLEAHWDGGLLIDRRNRQPSNGWVARGLLGGGEDRLLVIQREQDPTAGLSDVVVTRSVAAEQVLFEWPKAHRSQTSNIFVASTSSNESVVLVGEFRDRVQLGDHVLKGGRCSAFIALLAVPRGEPTMASEAR